MILVINKIYVCIFVIGLLFVDYREYENKYNVILKNSFIIKVNYIIYLLFNWKFYLYIVFFLRNYICFW